MQDIQTAHDRSSPDLRRPRVSVVVAAYNAEAWIGEAVESALAQTMPDLELVVMDDASQDRTADVVAAIADPRLKLVRNTANLGQARNWNRGVGLCRAPFVKFLCADDTLRPECLERMLEVAERRPDVGLVFARRTIRVEAADAAGDAWRRTYERMDENFGELAEVNDGRVLFDALAREDFPDNWIGEPTSVLMRRDAFERLGGFHVEIRQPVDFELWLRALFSYAVGFVPEPVATYRLVADSITRVSASEGSRWLDRLWLLESLRDDEEIRAAYPHLRRLIWNERAHAAGRFGKAIVRRRAMRQRLLEARRYVEYKVARDLAVSGCA
jgi:glycosyltransferase involved in cell wall biosynthesis